MDAYTARYYADNAQAWIQQGPGSHASDDEWAHADGIDRPLCLFGVEGERAKKTVHADGQ